MKQQCLIVIPILLYFVSCDLPASAQYEAMPGPRHGVVYQGKLLAAGTRRDDVGQHPVYFFQEPFPTKPARQPTVIAYLLLDLKVCLCLSHWRVQYDCFWAGSAADPFATGFRIPQRDWKYYDVAKSEWGAAEFRKLYPGDHAVHNIGFDPVGSNLGKLLAKKHVPLPHLDADELFVDFLPTGSTSMALFILHKGRMTVWHGSMELVQSKVYDGFTISYPHWYHSWMKGVTFKAGFQESFLALQSRDDWFFLTPSGKLYCSAQPKVGEARKCERVWGEAEQPITALITDADKDRTFFFCTKKGKAAGTYQSYFELSPQPTPLPIRPGAITAVPRDAGPLDQVRPLALFLVAQQHIRLKGNNP